VAQPIVLQDSFTRMIQDGPPDELPGDAAWEIVDFLPTLGLGSDGTTSGGRLAKRGGWLYACEDVVTDLTAAQTVTGLGYLLAQNRICLMTDNNKFGYFTPPGGSTQDVTLVSTVGIQPTQSTYVDAFGKLIITNNDGTTAPKYYDGTTFAALAGTPPTAKYAALWNDRLLLGGTAALPRRTYFSALGDATVWDTTNSWVDAIRPVTGYAVLPNALLIFGSDQTARIRGRIPPPDSPDMALDDPIFNIGCTFVNSIAVNGPLCVFANEEGAFLTNGTSTTQDLTQICGVKNTWQRYLANRQAGFPEDPSVYGGFIGNYYLAALTGTEQNPASFLFHLPTKSCVTTLSNYKAVTSVLMTPQVGDELFFGRNTRVISTSSIFTPQASNKNDASGTAVAPSITTRYFLDVKSFNKRWKTLYLDYAMEDAATDNPTLAVTFYPNWQNTTGSVTLASALTETTAAQGTIRAKMPIRKKARGGQFKIVQTNASKSTVIGALLADVHAMEGGRVS